MFIDEYACGNKKFDVEVRDCDRPLRIDGHIYRHPLYHSLVELQCGNDILNAGKYVYKISIIECKKIKTKGIKVIIILFHFQFHMIEWPPKVDRPTGTNLQHLLLGSEIVYFVNICPNRDHITSVIQY